MQCNPASIAMTLDPSQAANSNLLHPISPRPPPPKAVGGGVSSRVEATRIVRMHPGMRTGCRTQHLARTHAPGRPGVQASEPSSCDSPEVAQRGTEAMRERPSHYPHSPSTQENCLGITSYAEALQRVASIGKPIQQPGTADSNPTPDTRAPPDSPLRGRRGGRGAGVSDADTW